MSRIADELYFAPGIPFSRVDWSGSHLPAQYQQRIEGFYLKPAMVLGRAKQHFPSGLLVVCAIDAVALIMTGSTAVSARIRAFCAKIPELSGDQTATMFCEHFRNGLVHEARVKRGSEFSGDIRGVAIADRGRLIVNPLLLAEAVSVLLRDYVVMLNRSPAEKNTFRNKLKRKFRDEIES
jgi:hypothetical protein